MPNTIMSGRYGRTNGRPRGTWRPRTRVASMCSDVAVDELKPLLAHDLVSGRLRIVRETTAECGQQAAQGLARDQTRDHGVRPDRLVLIGDHAPTLPHEWRGSLHRRAGWSCEVRVLVQVLEPDRGGRAV